MARALMNGVSLARIQLKHGWRKLIGPSLLTGLAGGLALAAIAGAIRTSTAVDRMIEENQVAHVVVNPSSGSRSSLDIATIRSLPMVAAASRIDVLPLYPVTKVESFPELESRSLPARVADGGLLHRLDRPAVSSGRLPDPEALDEIFVDGTYADENHITVDDKLRWKVPDALEEAELQQARTDVEAVVDVVNGPDFGTEIEFTVVGIGSSLEGSVSDEGYELPPFTVTRALYESFSRPDIGFWAAAVRLDEPNELRGFRAAVDAMVPGELIVYQSRAEIEAKAKRATAPAATALVVFAVVVSTIGLVLVAQAFSRRLQLDATDVDTLAALGMTTNERFLAAMVRISVAAAAGAAIAVCLAWPSSTLMPVGAARRVEVDRGLDFDAAILIGGAGLLLAVVATASAAPAWRWSRRRIERPVVRRSVVASSLTSLGVGPSITTGVRFGLEPGGGRLTGATRATIIGAATAIGAVVAVFVFAASLDRVVAEPRLFGSNFDEVVEFTGSPPSVTDLDSIRSLIMADRAAASAGHLRVAELTVGGEPLTTLAFSGGPDRVGPTVAEGREPQSPAEIALGRETMQRLDVGIGDEVEVGGPGFTGLAEVVGRVVLPGVGLYPASDKTALGTGGVVVLDVLGPPGETTKALVLVHLLPGAEPDEFRRRMQGVLDDTLDPGLASFRPVPLPADIRSLQGLRELPITLTAAVVALLAPAVVHAMVGAAGARRRDIAILRALGATPGQVRMIGMWHGATLGGAAMLIGVPLGLIAGRSAWVVLATRFGTLAESVIPVRGLLLGMPTLLATVVVLALIPTHRWLRRSPSEVLRTE